MVDLLNRSTGRLGVSSEALQRMIEERQRNPGGFLANLAQQAHDEPLETASASGLPVVSDLADARLAGQSIGKAWRDPSKVNLLDASANVGLAALPFVGIGAIKAFHGSPHSFDKFDMSKIGTGEGAQAYGHGLYFAENEGVAKGYRDTLSHGNLTIDGRPVLDIAAEKHRMGLKDTPTDLHEIADALSSSDGPRSARANLMQLGPDMVRKYDEMLAAGRIKQPEGGLYDVNLDVNHEDLLDWDLPLSQQPPKVREALGQLGADKAPGTIPAGPFAGRVRSPPTGKDVYEHLGGRERAARVLREAGIPGIRYLDAGSRGGGEGSRNIVLFDDQLAEILGRR